MLVFGFHLLMITALLPEGARTTFSTIAAPVETLLATIGLWWASRRSAARSRQLQIAWGLFTAAHVSWLIGDIIWAVLEVGLGVSPFPSVADLFYILYYPLFIAGTLLIPMKRLSGSGWFRLLLDMGIVALATMLIFWYFWIGPLMETGPADFLTMALSVAYPVADFLLLAAIFVVLSRKSESQPEGPVWLLAAGIALQVFTDAVFGYQSTAGTYAGGILDMGWVGAVFLAGLAGFLHADAVTNPAASRSGGGFGSGVTESTAHWVVYLPYIWLVAVYLLLFIGSIRHAPMTLPGLITWVGVIILLVVARQVTSLRENIRLIDEQRQVDRALRESEEQYRTLFENSLDTMFTVDLEGNFTSLNQAGETLTGYRRDEMIGKNFRHFVSPEVAQIVFSAYNTLFKTNKSLSGFRYSFSGKHGRQLTVEGYVTLQKKGKTVIGFQGTLKDITERLKLEQQLIQSQKMEAVGTMAGGIAHNFNNIMVGIMGYSEFLMMSKKPDDPDYKALSIIHEGTLRASELTKQMLNVSRGGQFNLTAVKLNQAIERILPLITGTLDKSIDIQTHLAPDLMTIEGDVSQIEQCLLNLCINARDAMPEGGSIIIETQNQQLDDGFVRSHIGATAGPHVVVMITDTGTGIPPEVRDHIFEPFFTTKQHQGGTGMGLATVYGIVRSHRGIISVYTEQDKGTSFKLYFPVYSAVIDEIAARRRTARSMPGSTILLIDDEPVVREMWVDFLGHRGYHVITAEDGLEGIERFKSLRDGIDLVILDLIMPNLGGNETLAALRKIDPMVKVLITSGYSENGQAGRIVDMGIDGFIQKPTRLTHLEEEIVRILKK